MNAADLLGIVIATHNRRDTVLTTLGHLHQLEHPYPIAVVDNASKDGTPQAIREHFPRVTVIERDANIGAVARNDGVRRLQVRYIAFCDDDSWWEPGSLRQAIELFDCYSRLGMVQARILVGPEGNPDPCTELMAESPLPRPPDLPGMPLLGFIGCGVAFRREAFLQHGGFHERFSTGGEEALVAIDLASSGWGLSYIDSLIVHHHPSSRRDPALRTTAGVRNELWTSWLRRSPQDIARRFLVHLRRGLSDWNVREGIRMALLGLPWVLAERDPVPADIEKQIELLENHGAIC